MFRHKKACACLRVGGQGDAALFDGPISRLSVPEGTVLALSEEFFQDPEPCHIHRGAVLSRVFLELRGALEGRGQVAVEALSDRARGFLGAYPGARWVKFYEGETP